MDKYFLALWMMIVLCMFLNVINFGFLLFLRWETQDNMETLRREIYDSRK